MTPSSSQVFDGENYYNLDDQHNTQSANAFCKLNRSWYIDADPDEIKDDMGFRQIPPEVQALITQEVTEAAKAHPANKKPKAKAKRKFKRGKGEVTKLQLRLYAKQFYQAKMDTQVMAGRKPCL